MHLKSRLGSHSRSLEMAPLDKSCTSSYRRSTVTINLYCIISEIKRDIGRTIAIFHMPPAFDAPVSGIAAPYDG